MIAVYCRVSSARQRTDGQANDIRQWLVDQEIEPSGVLWFEDQESGSTTNRTEFQRLQKQVFSGRVKSVVVWKLDRLSRRLVDGVGIIADWCERGVRVVSVTQQVDLSGPVGRMLASVMFGLAEIENVHRAERQAAGIRVAKARSVYRGRSPGATKSNPKRARELSDRGLSASEIATALGVSERTVFRYLRPSVNTDDGEVV